MGGTGYHRWIGYNRVQDLPGHDGWKRGADRDSRECLDLHRYWLDDHATLLLRDHGPQSRCQLDEPVLGRGIYNPVAMPSLATSRPDSQATVLFLCRKRLPELECPYQQWWIADHQLCH